MFAKWRKIRQLEERLTKLEVNFTQNVATLASLSTQTATLRGAVNRKLGGKSLKADEELNSYDENNGNTLDEIRNAFGGVLPIELVDKFKS